MSEITGDSKKQLYVCKSVCQKHLFKNDYSNIAEKNFLYTGDLPETLCDINPTECRLIAQRFMFMKIKLLPAGGQRSISGPVINVLVDPQENCLKLPRKLSDIGTLPVRLKRKIEYKSVLMMDYVRPDKCVEILKFLKTHNTHYRNVVFYDDWIRENFEQNEVFFNAHFCDHDTVILINILKDIVDKIIDDVDGPECINNDELLPYDACLQPDNPIENELHGQPAVDFAPAQSNAPLSMLTDVNAEALAFPNLFPG